VEVASRQGKSNLWTAEQWKSDRRDVASKRPQHACSADCGL